MKHKFSSMLFAACAAVVSLTGLSGCGGGGDGDNGSKLSPMSLKDFARGNRHYHLINTIYGDVGSTFEMVLPTSLNQIDENGQVIVRGKFIAGGQEANDVELIYKNLGGTRVDNGGEGGGGEGGDGDTGETYPDGTYSLSISFKFTDDVTRPEFTAVLGGDVEAQGNNVDNGDGEGGVEIAGGQITIILDPHGGYSMNGELEVVEDDEPADGDNNTNVRGTGGTYVNMPGSI